MVVVVVGLAYLNSEELTINSNPTHIQRTSNTYPTPIDIINNAKAPIRVVDLIPVFDRRDSILGIRGIRAIRILVALESRDSFCHDRRGGS